MWASKNVNISWDPTKNALLQQAGDKFWVLVRKTFSEAKGKVQIRNKDRSSGITTDC